MSSSVCFADDTQLYTAVDTDDLTDLKTCIFTSEHMTPPPWEWSMKNIILINRPLESDFFAFYCFQVFSKRSFDRFNWLNSLFWPPVGLGRGFMTQVYTFSHGLVPEFCWYTVEVTHLNQIGFSFFFFYIVLLGVENRQRPMEKSDACRTYINDVYIYNCCSCFSDFHHL